MLLANGILPIVTYIVLVASGVGHAASYAASALWPLAYAVVEYTRTRKINALSILALVLTLTGAATALLSGSLRVTFAENSVVTVVYGTILIGSLSTSKPLMFYLARAAVSAGDPKKAEEWNGLIRTRPFRQTMWTITATWGAVYLFQGLTTLALIAVLPTSTLVKLNFVLPLLVSTVLVTWTIRYAKKRRAERMAKQPQMT